MRILGAAALLAIGAAVFQPMIARAAEPPCRFEEKTEKLSAVRAESTGDYFEDIRRELALRKDILRVVLSCAIKDAEASRESVSGLSGSAALEDLKRQFLGAFDDVLNYYRLQEERITNLGLGGSREFARGLKEWRQAHAIPLAAQAANLVLWARNDELVRTARGRFDRIERAEVILKFIQGEELRSRLDEARRALKAAERTHEEARLMLVRLGDSDATLALIRDSLDILKKTYESFFAVSDAVAKVLPR